MWQQLTSVAFGSSTLIFYERGAVVEESLHGYDFLDPEAAATAAAAAAAAEFSISHRRRKKFG
jgi:hypothetical protein